MFPNFFSRRSARALLGCLLAAASLLLPRMASGQEMVYSGVQSTLYGPVSYYYTPSPIAVDKAGEVFFVLRENSGHYYLEKIPSGGGTPAVLNDNLGFNPTAIAVNQAGTEISVIYSGSSRSCGGHYNSYYIAQATISSGSVSFGNGNNLPCTFTLGTSGYYTAPSGLAVDSSGTLYVADSGAHRLYEISSSSTTPTDVLNLSGGEPINLTVTSSGTVDLLIDNNSTNGVGFVSTSQFGTSLSGSAVTPTSLITGISSYDVTLAADNIGNVYVANSVVGPVRRIFGGEIDNKVDSRFTGGVYGLAADSSGNLYVAGANSSSQLLIGEDGQIGAGNFGNVAVGSSASYTYTFLSDSAVTVSSLSALTQGISGLDYQITSHNCSGTSYTTCTVTVQFSPAQPGLRSGAVVLTNSGGGVLGTGYLEGIGTAPAVAYSPGTQNVAISGEDGLSALALDGAQNLYAIQAGSSAIEKFPAGSGTPSTLATVPGANALALDGAGNLYAAAGANGVVEVAPDGTQTTVASTGITDAAGVAVDGAGTLYILDSTAQSLLRLPQGGNLSTWIKGLTTPGGVAVDSAGNVYVGNSEGSEVLQITSAGTQSTLLSGLNGIEEIAADAAGDLYFSSPLQGTILESPVGCTVADCRLSLGSGSTGLSALTLDGAGNLYYSQSGPSANVYELNRTTAPSLSFAATAVGSTSSDSPQSVTIGNIGNETLSAAAPGLSVGTDFQQVAGSGTPVDCSTSFSVASGAACNLSISFEPTVDGDLTESAVLTDNALNGNPATQTISLSGAAIALSPSSLAAATVGQIYSASFMANGGSSPYSFALGSGSLPAGLQLSSGGTISGTPTAAGVFNFTLNVTDNASATVSQSYTLTANAPTLVLSPGTLSSGTVGAQFASATITASGGTAPYSFALSAGALPPGLSLSASGALAGTPTSAGSFTITVTATDSSTGAGAPFSNGQSYTVQIAKGTPKITWTAPASIIYGTALSAVQLDATANVGGGFAYSPAAGAVLSAGTHRLSAAFTPTDQTDYTSQTATAQLNVNKVATSIALQTSTPNSNLDAQVTFTAMMQSAVSEISTGSVEFLDGSTVLGTSQLNAQGTATYSTSALTAGTHTINAVYSGDGNFLASSASLNQTVTAPAYSITAMPSALTLAAGQSGSVTLTMTPVGGFTGTIVLACGGLPNWVACQAAPQVLTANGSNTQQNATMVITTIGPDSGTVNNISSNMGTRPGNRSRVAAASFFFLPGLLLGSFLAWERKKLGVGWKCVLMLLVLVSTMSGMVGCGFSNASSPQGSYMVTVTGTSSATSALYTGPSNETVNFTLTITH